MRRILTLVVAALLAVGLVATPAGARDDYGVPGAVSAMTQNLYVGADLFRLLEPVPDCQGLPDGAPVTPEQCSLIVQAGTTLANVRATNFPERAETLARLMAVRRPAVIGLQEVSRITTIPTDPFGTPTGAPVVTDYLDLLLKALDRQGAHYRVAAVVDDANVQGIPAGVFVLGQGPAIQEIVGLLDRDVILVRSDVKADPDSIVTHRYESAQLSFPLGGESVEFTRSFVKVGVEVNGRRYAAVNTHLEVEFGPDSLLYPAANGFQAAQADELVRLLAGEKDPILLMGDFNSGPASDNGLPDVPTPYQIIAASGYSDLWNLRLLGRDPGYTCCQAELLDNRFSQLDERIDLIWLKHDGRRPLVLADTFGDKWWQKTRSGLWPSDHAGVVAYLYQRR